MTIAYKSAGAGVSSETTLVSLEPACPATVDANDILIAHIFWEGTSDAPSTPSGWTLLSGPHIIEATVARHWVYGRIADGSEDGATVTFATLPAVTTQRGARIYSFSGYASGTITDVVRGFNTTSTNATTIPSPTVRTTGMDSLAVLLVAQNDNNTASNCGGETGGDWTEAVAEYSAALTPGLVLQVQTAAMASPSTIGGGTVIMNGVDPGGAIGFEIRDSAYAGQIYPVSSGAGVATEASGGALSPLCPSVVAAGEILIAHCAYEGTSTTPDTPSGWTLLGGPYTIESAYRHWVFGKIADGSEDGAAVAFGTPAVTTVRWARVYSFSGRVSGTITECVPSASFAHLSHATDPQIPTVTTTIEGALAVACVAQADDNPQAGATGATGGTWHEYLAEYVQAATTPDTGMGLQICVPDDDPGTVTGGAIATADDPCGVIGFEIRPEVPVITGTGSPDASASTADGDGASSSTGTGSPDAQVSTVDGEGTVRWTGTGTLAAQASTAAGEGTVEDGAVSGTGVLAAQAAVVDGDGLSLSTGAGSPDAQAATVAASGASSSTGTGSPDAQAATVAGSGVDLSTGTGALVAQAADVTGAGSVAVDIAGAGVLASQAATADGDGSSSSVGAGSPDAQASTVDGDGASRSTGAGSSAAQAADATGVGATGSSGGGAVGADAADVAGAGASRSTGAGTLVSQVASVDGAGLIIWTGAGALVAQAADVTGAGSVSNVGAGAAAAAASTVSGEGGIVVDPADVAVDFVPQGSVVVARYLSENVSVVRVESATVEVSYEP